MFVLYVCERERIYECPGRPEEEVRAPGAVVTGLCALPYVKAGN